MFLSSYSVLDETFLKGAPILLGVGTVGWGTEKYVHTYITNLLALLDVFDKLDDELHANWPVAVLASWLTALGLLREATLLSALQRVTDQIKADMAEFGVLRENMQKLHGLRTETARCVRSGAGHDRTKRLYRRAAETHQSKGWAHLLSRARARQPAMWTAKTRPDIVWWRRPSCPCPVLDGGRRRHAVKLLSRCLPHAPVSRDRIQEATLMFIQNEMHRAPLQLFKGLGTRSHLQAVVQLQTTHKRRCRGGFWGGQSEQCLPRFSCRIKRSTKA